MTLDQMIELEKKATPGPWHADTSDPEDCVVWGAGDDGKFLANVGSDRMVPVRPDGAAILFDLDVDNCNLAVALRNAAPAYFEVVQKAKEYLAIVETGEATTVIDARRALRSALAKLEDG